MACQRRILHGISHRSCLAGKQVTHATASRIGIIMHSPVEKSVLPAYQAFFFQGDTRFTE